MKRASIAIAILLLACAGLIAAFLLPSPAQSPETAASPESETPLEEGLAIYADGSYGFTLFYPQDAAISYSFDGSYLLGQSWRADALPGAAGDALVQIVPYEIHQDAGYPRSYAALVRVGASKDAGELARCEEADGTVGETRLADREIHGTVWNAFSFGDAAMMQYVQGVSYRTVREGACVAIEAVREGSSYREESISSDVPQTELDAAYAELDAVIGSVSFAASE